MDIEELQTVLGKIIDSLKQEKKTLLKARLQGLISAFPFNEFEYALMFLLDHEAISFAEYEKLRANYVSSNKYLELFELAPRIFGEIWAQKHITDLDKRFLRPHRSLDSSYAGEYDLWIENVKVEVKACRAINTKKRGSLVSKALAYASGQPFWMNFQQIKPDACDVFIFVGVWVNEIAYWLLSKDQVKANKYLSHQHRGGIEYQIGITDSNIRDFDVYRLQPSDIADKITKLSRAKESKS